MSTTLEKFELNEKVIVITGGAGLLGVKHSQAVMEAKGNPVLFDIDEERLAKVSEDLYRKFGRKPLALSVDITSRGAVNDARTKVIRNHGRIDGLVNNAANNPEVKDKPQSFLRLEDFPLEVWANDIAVGLTGALICSQVFGSHFAENGGGVILNIASDLGLIAPDQRIYRKEGLTDSEQPVKPVTYSVVKHGLIGLSRYLATYWADKGVRSNVLCPGGVYNNQNPEFVKKLTSLIPMGRMANLDEYMGAIVFLLSDASSYMNGSVIALDGGRSVW